MINSLKDCYKLSNGLDIPCVGFGTWQTPQGELGIEAVTTALKCGYRHIDTAAIYGNEESVGKAIAKSGIPRNEIFVTSKLWNDVRGYDETIAAFNQSLDRLGLEYLDMYLIHWPNPLKYRNQWQKANAESWRAMEDLYEQKKIRAIGISNFEKRHTEELLKTAKTTPMVNQIRLYVGNENAETIRFSQDHEMLIEAYSPLGTGKIFTSPELETMAQKYGKSIAQICIRWSLQKGYLPLPKSVTPERIAENGKVFDFEISSDDIKYLDKIPNYCGATKNPDERDF